MNYKYYKFELIDDNFKEEFYKSVKEHKYKKIATEDELKDIKIEFYKKNHNKFTENKTYIIYVEAEEIDEDSLDLIMNYYSKKNIKENEKDFYNLYVVLNVSNCEDSECLSNFVMYGILTPRQGNRTLFGVNQLPMVYDKKDNILYVGYYPNEEYNKTRLCKVLFNSVYEYFEDYYRKYNLNVDDCITVKISKGKKFIEGLYPEKNIYTKYSEKGTVKEIDYKKITSLLFYCIFLMYIFIISTKNNNVFSTINILLVLAILSLVSEFIINKTKKSYKSYKKIKIDESSYIDVTDKLKKVLTNNKFQENEHNIYTKKNQKYYFIDEYNFYTMNINNDSFIIVDSYETYKRLNITKEDLKDKNIVALVYDSNMLYVINRHNEKMLSELYKIIKKLYQLK